MLQYRETGMTVWRPLTRIETVNLYVGNLSYDVEDNDLQRAFGAIGKVVSAKVIKDMESGRSRGFGFVEMGSSEEGRAVIQQLDGTDLRGRNITVNEARPKGESRSPGGSRGGFNGGNRGGRSDRW